MDEDKEVRALREELKRISSKIAELADRKENEDEMREEALQLIECEDPHKYRKKIIGFAAPFNMTEKDDRIAKDDKSRRYKFKSKEDKEIIKQRVKELKQQRQIEKAHKEKEKDQQYQKHRLVMKNLHHKLLREKGEVPSEGRLGGYHVRSGDNIYDISHSQPAIKMTQQQPGKSYGQVGLKQPGQKAPNKFTLESLGQLKYEDIAGAGPDEFNPADVLDEDDTDSEDEVLKRYRKDDNERNRIPVTDSIASLQVTKTQNQPYKGGKNTLRTMPVDVLDPRIDNLKGKHHKKGVHNNSIADKDQLMKKSVSKRNLEDDRNVKSKKTLLLKSQDTSPGKKNRASISDNEKIYKSKLQTNRSRKADLPRGATKGARKSNDPYESENQGKSHRYGAHVTRSVKKPSNKASMSQAYIDKSKI